MKIIIITGGSGTGKSTLGKNLQHRLSNSYLLSTDNYYKTGFFPNLLSKLLNSYFDKIISLDKRLIKDDICEILTNGSTSHYYEYDFKRKKKKKKIINLMKIDHLIIEGIFSLEIIDFLALKDYLLIRLKIDKKYCRERVFKRDKLERNKNNNNNDFNNGWLIYENKEKKFYSKSNSKELIFKNTPNLKTISKKISTMNS